MTDHDRFSLRDSPAGQPIALHEDEERVSTTPHPADTEGPHALVHNQHDMGLDEQLDDGLAQITHMADRPA